MQDLKYLTVSDLEKYLVGLREEINRLEKILPCDYSFEGKLLKEDKEIYDQVEHETLERTLLGAKTDGGCTN